MSPHHRQHLSSSGQLQSQRASREGVACRGGLVRGVPMERATERQHQAPSRRTPLPRGKAKRHQCKVWLIRPAGKSMGKQRKRCLQKVFLLLPVGCDESCLLAPVVEHGPPPVLLKVLQAMQENGTDGYFGQRRPAMCHASLHISSAPRVRHLSASNAFSAYALSLQQA